MLTDHDLDEMEKTFRTESKFNCVGGMGVKLLAEVRSLREENRSARIYGIKIAAEVARDYDKMSSHPFLVSDCILAKLNVLKGKPRKNAAADALDHVITRLERKVDSLAGTMRFISQAARRGVAQKR